MPNSLKKIIQAYNKWHKPLLDGFIDYYRKLELKDLIDKITIEYGKGPLYLSNTHYRRIKKRLLRHKKLLLLKNVASIKACENFNDIYTVVTKLKVKGIGKVLNYDIALAIGANLKKFPKVVYLHSNVLKAAQHLNLKINRQNTVTRIDFEPKFGEMKSHHIENLLCIYFKAIKNNPHIKLT